MLKDLVPMVPGFTRPTLTRPGIKGHDLRAQAANARGAFGADAGIEPLCGAGHSCPSNDLPGAVVPHTPRATICRQPSDHLAAPPQECASRRSRVYTGE